MFVGLRSASGFPSVVCPSCASLRGVVTGTRPAPARQEGLHVHCPSSCQTQDVCEGLEKGLGWSLVLSPGRTFRVVECALAPLRWVFSALLRSVSVLTRRLDFWTEPSCVSGTTSTCPERTAVAILRGLGRRERARVLGFGPLHGPPHVPAVPALVQFCVNFTSASCGESGAVLRSVRLSRVAAPDTGFLLFQVGLGKGDVSGALSESWVWMWWRSGARDALSLPAQSRSVRPRHLLAPALLVHGRLALVRLPGVCLCLPCLLPPCPTSCCFRLVGPVFSLSSLGSPSSGASCTPPSRFHGPDAPAPLLLSPGQQAVGPAPRTWDAPYFHRCSA